ncbi:MAG: hypothetical protein Q4F18_09960, partial [Clostridia bacterium]|nr:hypothetical protein [Clostridia bacterium]
MVYKILDTLVFFADFSGKTARLPRFSWVLFPQFLFDRIKDQTKVQMNMRYSSTNFSVDFSIVDDYQTILDD